AHRRSALVDGAHLDVHARRLVPPGRQHVVPVGVREQHRGFDGACPIRRVLPAVWGGGRGGAGAGGPELGGADGRRLGRNQRRDGRLRLVVPARTGAHARDPGVFRDDRRAAGVGDAVLLVVAPAPELLAGL